MRYILLSLLLFPLFHCQVKAQNITGVRAERMGGDSLKITYSLLDPSEERTYRIDLFAVTKNDTILLEKVSGEVGDTIRVGEHTVLWDAIGELGRYRGPISFLVRAIPSFLINDPEPGLKLKRGNPFTFTWYGGNSNIDDLSLVLYQYDNALDTIKVVENANQFTWQVPEDTPLGKGYRVKITGTSKTGIDAFTHDFMIVRRVPLYYIIAPAAALVGGTVAFLILKRKPLPEPIKPDE